MKKRLLPLRIKKSLVVSAAAMMLGAASHGAQIGINFQDNWGGTPYAPLTDSAGAFGIPLADWYNAAMVFNSGPGGGVGTNGTFAVPGGGDLNVAWACQNTWSLTAAIPTFGDDQIIYGYLDDPSAGYTVTLRGLRGFASSFTITTIASTDGGSEFMPVSVFSKTETNTVEYLSNYVPSFASGLAGTSTVSTVFTTLNGNDSVTVRGLSKTNSQIRSTLAGILISFTPGGNNPPLIESNPQTPAGILFPGSSFILNSLASGSPTLVYHWRKGGINIPGATFASYTNSSAVVGDTGNYDVVVTNNFGSITSAVALVTIQNVTTPVITQSPISQSLYQGYPATFTVVATGGQLTYQWKSNNVAISGATNATFSISSVTTGSAGTYTVDVNNPVGPLVSASATLTVKVPVSSYESVVAGTKPEFWLRYSETGPVLQDTATNSGSLGIPGTGLYFGSVSRLQTGALAGTNSTAVSFSGGRVSVPYSASLNPAVFTVEAWLKPNAVNAPGTLTCPLSSVHIADPRSGWLIYQSDTGWNFRTYNQNGTTTAISITGGPAPVVGQWYHVVASWDGTVGKVYVNGGLSATSATATYVPNPDGAFSVGARNDAAFVWAGAADEVAHYSAALSDSEILAHYQNGTNASRAVPYQTLITTNGAVEYLQLNDTMNLSPATNSGTLGTAWTGAYKDGSTVVGSTLIAKGVAGPQPATYPGFESTNRAVDMFNGLATTQPFGVTLANVTITCWIKRAGDFSTDDLSWLTWLGSSQSGGFHLNEASSQPTPGELRYHWDGTQYGWASGLIVPENVWTFCAMVLTPTNVTMYMSDGGTLKQASRAATHTPHTLNLAPGFGGGQQDRSSRNYIGQMDESTVHFRALSQSEITTMFLVGTGAPFEMGIVPGGVIADSKPVGTPHNGANYQTTWLASSTDGASVTRSGVEVFATANTSQITVPADPDFDSTSGTFTFWMKADAPIPGPGTEAAILMDRRTAAGAVIALSDAGSIFVQCAGGANTFGAGYLPDGLWHHVAVTYDQSASGSIEIFVDGISQGAQANTTAWSWPATQQIELGRSHDGYWKRYDGQMDDFRIYGRVLTQPEIASAASGALVDTSALKLRFNFDTAGIGNSVTWPFGTLLSSPTVGPGAIWTPVPGAVPPAYPLIPTEPARFFRATP